jgi:hypothetical protein
MLKIALSSLCGLVIGLGVVYLAGQILLALQFDADPAAAAAQRGVTVQDYIAWRATIDLRVLWLSFAGGLVCAGLFGLQAAVTPEPRRRRRRLGLAPSLKEGHDAPLNPAEFQQLSQLYQWPGLNAKSAAYVQGFLVGQLIHTAPDLAVKVDQFSDEHMAAVHADLRAWQKKLG